MNERICDLLRAFLLTLQSDLLDIRLWFLRRIVCLLERQCDLLDAAIAYTERHL